MNQFMYWNPVKWIFGKGTAMQLRDNVAPFGENILLVYGGGSIKKSGLYDEVIDQLDGFNITELSGVEPNPRLSTVKRGAELCRANDVSFILAVGGGSVIDCTKAIAAAAKFEGDPWDFITRKATVEEALPFGTILTHAATASEMNSGSVITNWDTNEKLGWGSPHTFPKFSICDPKWTLTVPRDQTVYGVVDMMSHMLEQYFHNAEETDVQDRLIEGTMKTLIEKAPALMNNLQDEKLRETVMFAGTLGLNGMLQMGYRGDWATHNIEHAVSAVYDIPHGGGLAIIFPNWMNHNIDVKPERFKQLAVRVFDVDPEGKSDREAGLEGIEALRAFWTSIGAPSRLADYDIDDSRLEEMAEKTLFNGPFGNFTKLDREDVVAILRASL
ncbi:iron-containing alcohol dehydrogenase [Domibacillus sp. DTU_2020_1001157_1_SI_ALB_TIR_016]|uniref:iron-containing alcohol dehydrogenase n=1 Tax=Domibacillus sp. DTU_2020_1001157_1_SI_ALB_TIR_016 TaxID=3077789 RepID=UPI0028E7ED1D|nr:iron-containing alcohol dehydrogenase [Domibacillus sp. DTU_2020_1001157_1_SI_ALB_TIR_016]WNS81657.1 iron-containing alcohol dehydrogenase [Domibacillus sp. DTU_2020_1001157_1_SI_ALB_TIR_016]